MNPHIIIIKIKIKIKIRFWIPKSIISKIKIIEFVYKSPRIIIQIKQYSPNHNLNLIYTALLYIY